MGEAWADARDAAAQSTIEVGDEAEAWADARDAAAQSTIEVANEQEEEPEVAVTIRIPTQLRELSGGAAEVDAGGDTVAAVLSALETAHPGFSERLFDESGQLRRFVNVFVADEDIRFLNGVDTPVAEGQTVSIVPAVAGG